MNDVIQQNLVLLHHRQPDAAKVLQSFLRRQREQNLSSPYQVFPAKNRQPCLLYQRAEKSVPLHDGNTPFQEVAVRFQNALCAEPDGWIVYSSGLGYFLPVLLPGLARHKLILVEPDPALLFEALRISDWRQALASANLHVFLGEEAVDECLTLLRQHPSLLLHRWTLLAGRALMQEDQPALRLLQDALALPPDRASDSHTHLLLCGNAHQRLIQPLVQEAHAASIPLAGQHRPAYINRFLSDRDILTDTVGHPYPKHILSFTKNVLREDEWKALSDAGVQCALWCYDDPFRAGVDAAFFQHIDRVYCYDPLIADRLRALAPIPVSNLSAATAFSENTTTEITPITPWTKQTWDVSFVGSTGLQRHDDRLTQWITHRHPVYQRVLAMVEHYCRQGTAVPYHELLSLSETEYDIPHPHKTVYLQDLATFLVRRFYLSHIPPPLLSLFGDRGWAEPSWVQELSACYSGQSLHYNDETPFVYANSKINLNLFNIQCVNSPTIRMFDVMACGGFLLTEHRPFMDSLFKIGTHLDVFHTPQALTEKIQYYLTHEDERREIARRGQEYVLHHHRYRYRLPKVFGSS